MSQHNRKDPRAKVLSMTVRYRSATLNEFIEHHSYDVSRGGLFIKTPSPFAPGTLLKFEVKIAGDQRVLQGVGRVVWKRDVSAGPDEHAGMGIKFIKLDETSKAVIERLVANRGDDTVSAFDRSPDSRNQQMFPGSSDSFSDDPTVVRVRSELSQDVSPVPSSSSGVNPTMSIPVPSGPALSMGAPASMPNSLDMGPLSEAVASLSGGTSLPAPSLKLPNPGGPSVPPAPTKLGGSIQPAPTFRPPKPVPSAAPLSDRTSPSAPASFRKPGPVPVTSTPPPKSAAAYVWVLLGAALAGGGFLYLKLNRHLLRPETAPRPAAVSAAPALAPAPTNSAPVVPSTAPAAPEPAPPASAAAAAPAPEAEAPSAPLDLDKAEVPASPTAAPEASPQPTEPVVAAAPVAPRPSVRKKKAPKEDTPETTPSSPAAGEQMAPSAPPEPTEPAAKPADASPPSAAAPAPAAPAPAAPPPTAPAEEEFR